MYYFKIIHLGNNTNPDFNLQASQTIYKLFFSLIYKSFFLIWLKTLREGIERERDRKFSLSELSSTTDTCYLIKSSLSPSPSHFLPTSLFLSMVFLLPSLPLFLLLYESPCFLLSLFLPFLDLFPPRYHACWPFSPLSFFV